MQPQFLAVVGLMFLAAPVLAQTSQIAAEIEQKIEFQRLQGAWLPRLLVTEAGVEPYPLQGRALVFAEKQFARTEGRRLVLSGSFRIEPKHRHLDFVVEQRDAWDAEFADAKQKPRDRVECTYRVVGDLLTVCYGSGKKGRPNDLKPGAGRSVVVYERQKDNTASATVPRADGKPDGSPK